MEVLQHSRFSRIGDCKKMKEFRLEKGKIRAFHTDDDAVSPSYVDEKIRQVLQRFGKDFEGKSSEEKLGPMFGGYGSFLLTDERNLGPGKNLRKNLQPEEGGDSRVSTNTVKLSSSTVPSVLHGSINKDVNGTHADPQQKVRLKVRIKMGSIDFSAKNFSEIYNGLDLNISSPSSLEDSPMEADVSFSDIEMGSEVNNENRFVSSKPLRDNKNGKSPKPDALSQKELVSNVLPTKGVHALNLANRPMSRSCPPNITKRKKKCIHSLVEKNKETKKEEKESNLNEHYAVRMKNKRKNAQDNFEPSKKTKKECTQKDSSTEAATNVVKEATELKYLADRLKKSVSNSESTELYLQAALKFLHGASLYESCNNSDGAIQIYRSTAKLCEFCAREYEKFEDMGGAALAYKCMEVAYMRASQSSAVKDHHELRVSIKMAPLDESKLIRKSGVDNLNNVATKVLNDKGSAITSSDLPSFQRTLNHVQDTIFAMEASKKSRIAFAATELSMERTKQKDSISSIRKVIEFSFHDIECFIHLVRVAMEATPSI